MGSVEITASNVRNSLTERILSREEERRHVRRHGIEQMQEGGDGRARQARRDQRSRKETGKKVTRGNKKREVS